MKLPDAERFATLIAVVETGSFRRAAATRFLAPSTVQKQMRSLEASVGMPLFDRSGREIRIRPEAFDLAAVARDALDANLRLGHHLERLRNGKADAVHVVCAPIHLARSLGVLSRAFEEQHGVNVAITLLQAEHFADVGALCELLRTGQHDVIVTMSDLPGCRSVPLWSTALVAVMGSGFSPEVCTVADLGGRRVFAQQAHVWSRRTLEMLAVAEGVELDIITESLPEVCISLTQAGMGVAVVADDNVVGLETAVPLLDAHGAQPSGTVCAHASRRPSAATELFLQFTQEWCDV
jgi:LysR family cyn operon transcriptional activator